MNGETLKPYYTIYIPWAPPECATQWHPTEKTGPLKVLCRGSFPTLTAAIWWGQKHLDGTPYSIKYVDENGDVHDELP